MPKEYQPIDLLQTGSVSNPASGFERLYAGTDTHLYKRGSGGGVLQLTAVDPDATVVKSSDSSTTSTGLADVPGLLLPVVAGQYMFEFRGTWQNDDLLSAIFGAVNGPTLGANGLLVLTEFPSGETRERQDAATTYNAPHGAGFVDAINTRYRFGVWGYVHVTASGNIALRYRSDVSGSTTTVHKGATGKLWRVG